MTPAPTIDITGWRKAMEGVTPGPWRSTGGYLTVRDQDGSSFTASIYHLDEMGQKAPSAPFQSVPFARPADATWVARCYPSAITALLDALEACQAREAELREVLGLIAQHEHLMVPATGNALGKIARTALQEKTDDR